MNNQAMLRVAVRIGVIAGALCIAWLLFLHWTGQNPLGPKSLVSIIVLPIAGLIGQWQLRRFHPEHAGFLRSLLVGVATVLVTTLISTAGMYGLARLGGEPMLKRNYEESARMLEAARKEFTLKQLTQEAYEANKKSLPVARGTAIGVASEDFQKKLLWGLLFCLPGAVFFRK